MSDLAQAVAAKLKRGAVEDVETIEEILREAGISTAAAVPTPVRLRIEEVSFRGTKRILPKDPSDDEDPPDREVTEPASPGTEPETLFTLLDDEPGAQPDEPHSSRAESAQADASKRLVDVPFDFTWRLGPGLYGVGSHENHRGKSTVSK